MQTYSDIKNKLNLNILKEQDEGAAYFTHFLYNQNSPLSKYFKKPAKEYWKRKTGTELKNTLNFKQNVPFPEPQNPKFTFIDLFSGIGGFRIAMQNLGGKCVFSSEKDKFAKKTYETNFGEVPFGDITKISEQNIPEHDVLCAGFPCQAFSIAGKRKGFKDETRGTLFFDIARIIEAKKPKAFFLENVKGLTNHDKGRTLKTILKVLRDDLNYFVPEPQCRY